MSNAVYRVLGASMILLLAASGCSGGDGDLDVGSAEYLHPGPSYVWFENTGDGEDEPGPFTRHVMTDELGRAIQLEAIPDLLGDGRDGWVGSHHVNTVTGDPEPPSVVSLLTPPADPTPPPDLRGDRVTTHRGRRLSGRAGGVRSRRRRRRR